MVDVRTHRRVIGVLHEDDIGVWETELDTNSVVLSTGAANFYIVGQPTFTQTPIQSPRDIRVSTFARPQDFYPGVSQATIVFTTELAGHSDGASPTYSLSPVGRLLACCGLDDQLVLAHAGAAAYTTGYVFEHGEGVTFVGSGATAVCFGSATADMNSDIYVEDPHTGGTPLDADVLTGDDSLTAEAIPTLGTNQLRGLKLSSADPVDSDQSGSHTASILYLFDGREVRIRGAQGNAVFTWTTHMRPTVTFTFTGILEDTGGVGAARAFPAGYSGASEPGPTLGHLKPEACVGMTMKYDPTPTSGSDTSVDLDFNTVTFDTGNTIVMHPDATHADGFSYARIESRSPTLSVDIDADQTGLDYEDLFQAGTPGHLLLSSGATAGNIWELRAPAALHQSRAEGDREDVTNHQTTFNLHGGVGPSGRQGFDSEYVIVNR